MEVRPEPVVTELAEKLTEVGLEDVADKKPEVQKPQSSDTSVEVEPEVKGSVGARSPASTSKPVVAKEEVAQDLRVFELNSDSGKSTPSNNGKKGTVTFWTALSFGLRLHDNVSVFIFSHRFETVPCADNNVLVTIFMHTSPQDTPEIL